MRASWFEAQDAGRMPANCIERIGSDGSCTIVLHPWESSNVSLDVAMCFARKATD